MLSTSKNVSIDGTSSVDGKTVISLHANIPANGNVSVNETLLDKELYEANSTEVDTDVKAFKELAYSTGGVN